MNMNMATRGVLTINTSTERHCLCLAISYGVGVIKGGSVQPQITKYVCCTVRKDCCINSSDINSVLILASFVQEEAHLDRGDTRASGGTTCTYLFSARAKTFRTISTRTSAVELTVNQFLLVLFVQVFSARRHTPAAGDKSRRSREMEGVRMLWRWWRCAGES